MSSTKNYGAITEIVDNTTVYSMKDSTGMEFTFEVYPININENEINETLNGLGIDNLWLIGYKTSIVAPRNNEIQKAIEEGMILKLSMNCLIVDNYGIFHKLEFDNEQRKYKIKVNSIINILIKEVVPLSDFLIDFIKESDNIKVAIISIGQGRQLYTKLFSKIKDLEDRVKLLEQK